MNHPMQPIGPDAHGRMRFKENKLVRAILDHSTGRGLGMNELARKFSSAEHIDDWRQLAQLIGYSLSGFGELPYVDVDTYNAAEAMAYQQLSEDKARIAALEEELNALRSALREPIARLYGKHPDDLMPEDA